MEQRSGDENLDFLTSENAFSCFVLLLSHLIASALLSERHSSFLINTQKFLSDFSKDSKKNARRGRNLLCHIHVGGRYLFFMRAMKYIFNVSSWRKKHAKMIFCLFSLRARHESAFSTKRSIFFPLSLFCRFFPCSNSYLNFQTAFMLSFPENPFYSRKIAYYATLGTAALIIMKYWTKLDVIFFLDLLF